MGVIDRLARLDARVVPRLARGLARLRRGAGRLRVNLLAVSAAVLVLTVVATAAWRIHHPFATSAESGSTVRVGVRDGDLIKQYATSGQTELDGLVASGSSKPMYALVSLAMYLDPDRLTEIVAEARADAASAHAGDLTTVAAYARVPLPRRQTQIVRLAAQRLPEDVVASMAKVAEQKASDALSYTRRAQAESGAYLRGIYESNASLAAAEAQAYGLNCACVYALVVRATPAVLRVLATCKEIRVVDPAPEVTDLRTAVFAAPLPEQIDRVEPPPDDGLPPATETPRSPPIR